MDIGRALTFFTEEDRWVEKTTIGALVLLLSSLLSFVLVGVLGFFIVMGYSIRLMRNVQAGVKPVLPEWDQWGDDLVRGIKLFVVQFVWALPVVIVILPVILGAAIADSGGGGEFFGVLLMLCGGSLAFLYGLFMVLIQPGYTIAFARDEKISSGFQLTEIWQWTRNHLSDVIVVAIVYVVATLIIGMVAGIVGVILCGIGLIVTLPLSQLVIYYMQYHLYGQLDPGSLGTRVSRAAVYEGDYSSGVTVTPTTVAPVTPVEPMETDVPPVPPVNEPPVPPEQSSTDVGGEEKL
jgi:hypothetical protein